MSKVSANEFNILLTYWYGIPSMPETRTENIRKAGFKYLSLHWCDEYEAANGKKLDILKECHKRDLKIEVFHLPFEEAYLLWESSPKGELLYNTYKKSIEDANKYGVKYLVMHLNSDNKNINNDINIGVNRLKKLLEYAKKLDVNIAFENLAYQDNLEKIEQFLYQYSNACLCFDVGHNNIKNSDFVIKHKDKIKVMHIHDNFGKEDIHKIPYTGTVNWDDVHKLINDVYNQCLFVLEVQNHDFTKEQEFLSNAYLSYIELTKNIKRRVR